MEVAAASAASYGFKADDDVDSLRATELRLGLPGTEEEEAEESQNKAPPPPPSTPRGKKRDVVASSGPEDAPKKRDCETDTDAAPPPAAK